MENCEVGYYCPDPETKIICPKGFFCPYKTTIPEIVCSYCKEGAPQLVKDRYGMVALAIVIGSFIIYMCWKLFKHYNRNAVDRFHNFQRSFLSNHFSEFEHRMVELKNKSVSILTKKEGEDLEKLRPKLELINRRIKDLQEEQGLQQKEEKGGQGPAELSGSSSIIGGALEKLKRSSKTTSTASAHSIDDSKKPIEFDGRHAFDVLDADDSGDVSFEELNRILGFNEFELSEFVRRMNELGGDSKLDSVTRPVFVKYFLQVLKDTSNLTVSFEEAEELFMEMSMGKGDVHMSKFYSSSMNDFLSDIQILDLIKVRTHYCVFA
jgi:Ca2+-binding EF-hand superfamily protein